MDGVNENTKAAQADFPSMEGVLANIDYNRKKTMKDNRTADRLICSEEHITKKEMV